MGFESRVIILQTCVTSWWIGKRSFDMIFLYSLVIAGNRLITGDMILCKMGIHRTGITFLIWVLFSPTGTQYSASGYTKTSADVSCISAAVSHVFPASFVIKLFWVLTLPATFVGWSLNVSVIPRYLRLFLCFISLPLKVTLSVSFANWLDIWMRQA